MEDTCEDRNAQPTSLPDVALSPLPDDPMDDVAAAEPSNPALQTNPLFDQPEAQDIASPVPTGKENSTPAAAQATPSQLTEEAMRRAYEKGCA